MKLIKKIKKLAADRKLISRNIRGMEHTIQCSIRSDALHTSALFSKEKITTDEIFLEKEVVVSFTTFSKKIHEVYLVIESIAQQTIRPNRLILWLDEAEFNMDNIPHILHRQIERGLEVRFCPNYRSYKKIIPTLELCPESYIVTIDDDVLYGFDCLEILLQESKRNPNVIVGHRAHEITLCPQREVKRYKKWKYGLTEGKSSHRILLTGCGSILYPPHSLHPDVMNIERFTELAPSTDDLWLKIMAVRNDTICKKTDYSSGSYSLKRNRDIGLAQENIRRGGNDKQCDALLAFYPEVLEALRKVKS